MDAQKALGRQCCAGPGHAPLPLSAKDLTAAPRRTKNHPTPPRRCWMLPGSVSCGGTAVQAAGEAFAVKRPEIGPSAAIAGPPSKHRAGISLPFAAFCRVPQQKRQPHCCGCLLPLSVAVRPQDRANSCSSGGPAVFCPAWGFIFVFRSGESRSSQFFHLIFRVRHREHPHQLVRVHCGAVIKSLLIIAAPAGKQLALMVGLHALGDHLHAQLVGD